MTVIPELREALVNAARDHAATARRAGSRRRLWWRGFGGGVASLALIAGLATASGLVVSQRTLDEAEHRTHDTAPTAAAPGKAAEVGADLVALAQEVQAEIPYPPGMRDTYDWSKYSVGATLGTGRETRREVLIMSENRASCLWRRYLVRAHAAGDRAAVSDAIAVLRASARWPGARTLGATSGWHAAIGRQVADAQRGDYSAIRADLAINCAELALGASPREVADAEHRLAEWRARNRQGP